MHVRIYLKVTTTLYRKKLTSSYNITSTYTIKFVFKLISNLEWNKYE